MGKDKNHPKVTPIRSTAVSWSVTAPTMGERGTAQVTLSGQAADAGLAADAALDAIRALEGQGELIEANGD